jgi:antitoxin (DNA-binding transcriptional repressor) of toxin-antitoxin stability system
MTDAMWHSKILLAYVATSSYFCLMKAVGIKVLKNKLSEYVRLAAAGETVLVTDRDRVVAQITAPDETRSPLLADAVLADAVRQGWLTPPAIRDGNPPPTADPVAPLSELLAELDADRSER